MAPRFTNTITEMPLSVNEGVGNTVYTVSYTDDDTGDVTSLDVTMETNAYFDFVLPGLFILNSLLFKYYEFIYANFV